MEYVWGVQYRNFNGKAGGDVVRARGIARLVPGARWDPERMLGVTTTPLTQNTRWIDAIEASDSPASHSLKHDAAVDAEQPSRRVRIMLQDVQRHGFLSNRMDARFTVLGANAMQQEFVAEHACTTIQSNAELSFYDCLRKEGSPNILAAEEQRLQPNGILKQTQPSSHSSSSQAASGMEIPMATSSSPATPVNDAEAAELFGPDELDEHVEFHRVAIDEFGIVGNAKHLEDEHSTIAPMDVVQALGVSAQTACHVCLLCFPWCSKVSALAPKAAASTKDGVHDHRPSP